MYVLELSTTKKGRVDHPTNRKPQEYTYIFEMNIIYYSYIKCYILYIV